MIQRIQSIWLLLAALVMAGMFYFDVYHFAAAAPDPVTQGMYNKVANINNNYLAMVLSGLSVILSLVSIFMFKNRKRQIGLVWINILLTIGLLIWLAIGLTNFKESYPDVKGTLWVGMFIPTVTVFLLFFALRGLRKDEKLIKSLDRLR